MTTKDVAEILILVLGQQVLGFPFPCLMDEDAPRRPADVKPSQELAGEASTEAPSAERIRLADDVIGRC